jgi:hypothetical protein
MINGKLGMYSCVMQQASVSISDTGKSGLLGRSVRTLSSATSFTFYDTAIIGSLILQIGVMFGFFS